MTIQKIVYNQIGFISELIAMGLIAYYSDANTMLAENESKYGF